MPKRETSTRESLWVPRQVRAACYHCGLRFSNDEEKINCRLCFDVFCDRCMGMPLQMPPSYGYSEPQPVCVSCELLVNSFPTFACQIHHQQGGQLLPPSHAAFLIPHAESERLAVRNDSGNASRRRRRVEEDREEKKPAGFFASIAAFFSRRPADRNDKQQKALPRTNSSQLGSAAKKLGPETAVPVTLLSWRPLNPMTTLHCGAETNIFLKDIRVVEFTSDERTLVLLSDGRALELVVGQLDGAEATVWTADATASFRLATGLSALVRHCRNHFAFSPGSMALHPDFCPGASDVRFK